MWYNPYVERYRNMKELVIENLHVAIEGREILKGLDLKVGENEVHALMGPNGNGKSTLLAAIMGHPKYEVTEGSVTYDGKDVLSMAVDERSRAGIFLGMQYPQEISGVTNSDFLKAAINARRETPISLFEYVRKMQANIRRLELREDIAHRFLNEGFSGGEKKRNEILQLMMLGPSLAMLDEIDSGLDVDALKIVAETVNQVHEETKMSVIVVSHYERFLEYVKPQFTHILIDGRIVVDGGAELAERIDAEGYDWIYREYNVLPAAAEEEKKRPELNIRMGGR